MHAHLGNCSSFPRHSFSQDYIGVSVYNPPDDAILIPSHPCTATAMMGLNLRALIFHRNKKKKEGALSTDRPVF